MRVRKVKSDDVKIHDSVQVKLKTSGNTQVVQFTAGVNKSCLVRNLSKDTYLDTKTGEVKQKKKSENRYQSPKSVRKSINRLMDLVRCNATHPAKCKWITVTYADVMTDCQQSFKYITVAEPQGETHGNSWHLHILLIFDDIAPLFFRPEDNSLTFLEE